MPSACIVREAHAERKPGGRKGDLARETRLRRFRIKGQEVKTMKITISAIAAMFSLFMLVAPGSAKADAMNWQSGGIEQVGFFGGRPIACHNHYFRHHHWRLCR
jgi:hypothetical protein